MSSAKYLGIWMDHSHANLVEFSTGTMVTKSIVSPLTNEVHSAAATKGDNRLHNTEQRLEAIYFKELMHIIKEYESVLLFGPTDAKSELHNLIKADHHFEKIHVATKTSDTLTENQQHAFVKEFFTAQSAGAPQK